MVRTLQIYIGIHIHKGTDKCFNICLKVCYEKFKILRIVVRRQCPTLYSILLYIFLRDFKQIFVSAHISKIC